MRLDLLCNVFDSFDRVVAHHQITYPQDDRLGADRFQQMRHKPPERIFIRAIFFQER